MQLKNWLCFTLLLSLAACNNKPPTEAEQYAALTDSFKYRGYSTVSEAALPEVIVNVNQRVLKEAPELAQKAGIAKGMNVAHDSKPAAELDLETARSALAMLWILQASPDFGIAEANISLRQAKSEEDKYISSAVLGLGMYQKGWRTLAMSTTADARAAMKSKKTAEQMYEKEVLLYLGMGLVSMQSKDYQTASVAFAGLGNVTGITWMSDAADAMFLMQQGKLQDGMSKLKVLSQNPTLSERDRKSLAALITHIESNVGDVDSPLFWPRLFGQVVLKQILAMDTSRLKELFAGLEKFKSASL